MAGTSSSARTPLVFFTSDHHRRRRPQTQQAIVARILKIHFHIQLISRKKSHGEPARGDGLDLFARQHTTTHVVTLEQVADGDVHG